MTNTNKSMDQMIEEQLSAVRDRLRIMMRCSEAAQGAVISGLRERGLVWENLSGAEIVVALGIMQEGAAELSAAVDARCDVIRQEVAKKMEEIGVECHREHGTLLAARIAAVLRPGSAS